MTDQPFLSILYIGVLSGLSFWQLSLGNSPTTSNSVRQLLATTMRPALPRTSCAIGIGQGQAGMHLGAVPAGINTERNTSIQPKRGKST